MIIAPFPYSYFSFSYIIFDDNSNLSCITKTNMLNSSLSWNSIISPMDRFGSKDRPPTRRSREGRRPSMAVVQVEEIPWRPTDGGDDGKPRSRIEQRSTPTVVRRHGSERSGTSLARGLADLDRSFARSARLSSHESTRLETGPFLQCEHADAGESES